MSQKSVIVRFHEFCIQEDSAPLNRLSGFMYGASMVDLIDEFLNEKYAAEEMELLESNPRNPKRTTITADIISTLKENSELFPLMSKGILVSAAECKKLERNRFEISFVNPRINGILDGGHNTLAVALYFLEKAGAFDNEIRKVKRWTDLKALWNAYSPVIEETKKLINFLMPAEIIYPKVNAEDEYDFVTSIMDIAQARNNNTQLSEETKANKKGHYESLKQFVDPNLEKKIEWRTNDGGLIKVRELVALSLIPLSKLEIGKDINPVQIYSSKADCVRTFDKIITDPVVSVPAKGDFQIEIRDQKVLSALKMVAKLPELYDLIYESLPDAYNKNASGKFGRINSVTWDDDKNVGKTKYYGHAVIYAYPEGFIMPLMYSMRELMQEHEVTGNLVWIVDPTSFVKKYLKDILSSYGESVIKMAKYDPQVVGKNRGSYAIASMAVRDILMTKKII